MKQIFIIFIVTCFLSLNVKSQVPEPNIEIPVLTEKSTLRTLEKYATNIQKVTTRVPKNDLYIFAKAFYSFPLYKVLKYRSLDVITQNKKLFKELIKLAPRGYAQSHSSDMTRLWVLIAKELSYDELYHFINYGYDSTLVIALKNVSDFVIDNLGYDSLTEKSMLLATRYHYNVNERRKSYFNNLLKIQNRDYLSELSISTNKASQLVLKNLNWIEPDTLIQILSEENHISIKRVSVLFENIFIKSTTLARKIIKKIPNKTIGITLRAFEDEYQLTELEEVGFTPEHEIQTRRAKLTKSKARLITSYIGESEELAKWFFAQLLNHRELQEARTALLNEVFPILSFKYPKEISFLKLIQNYATRGTFISDAEKLEIIKVFSHHRALPLYSLYKQSAFMIELSEKPLNYIKYLLIKKNRNCNNLLK